MSAFDPEVVPADDRGLLLGDGLFETVRIYRGHPFRLESHLRRLDASAAALGFPMPDSLRERVAAGIAAFDGPDGALRITLTRGAGVGLAPPPEPRSRLFISVRAIGPEVAGAAAGVRARLFGRLDEHALTSGHKAIGYLERIQALRLAKGLGADEALLRNARGLIVEGSASNLFAVRGTTFVAPGLEAGALPGITRGVLLEVARGAGLTVEERGIHPEELVELSEILLSSSLREVVPVIEVEGARVGEGRPGPTFTLLSRMFREVVRKEIGR
ncbi:MAG: aminotransferase class IV [Gemmatimonadota bacterium]